MCHTTMIGILQMLQEGKPIDYNIPDDYIKLGRMVRRKLKALASNVKKLRSKFDPNTEPLRDYGIFVKMPMVKGACRLGSYKHHEDADEELDSDDDTELSAGVGSDRVLNREEIKEKSARTMAQGLLRRGCRESASEKRIQQRKKLN